MRRFQLTETRKCKPGDCLTDVCHPGITGDGALRHRPPNSCRKNSMISYEEEIKRFKPSLDVDQIEDAIAKVDLTDMNDIMTSLIEEAIKHKKDESAK